MKKKQIHKKPRGIDEELMVFVVKIVGSTALLFITAIGFDVYQIFH